MNSFKLNKARPKDKFPLPNIDLLIDPTKATTISTMKRHTTIRELKSFLKIVSYIRKFTPRPTLVISGLSKLLKKGNIFIWGVGQPNVFHKISTDHESFAYHMGTIHGKITIVVPGILIPSIQSIEEH